jgi:hypothetical protein
MFRRAAINCAFLKRVSKSGYQPAAYGASTAWVPPGIIKLAAGEFRSEFGFHLQEMGSISSMVIDEDGDPLGGVQVMTMTPGFSRQKRTLLPGLGTATDANGRYRLGLQPGRYVVVVTHY